MIGGQYTEYDAPLDLVLEEELRGALGTNSGVQQDRGDVQVSYAEWGSGNSEANIRSSPVMPNEAVDGTIRIAEMQIINQE